MPLNTIQLPANKARAKDRGKVGEKKVKEALTVLKARCPGFNFKKIADAYAGSLTPVAGDFSVEYLKRSYVIEVKEVAHDFRLPHNNVSFRQLALMRKKRTSGVVCFFLVYHSLQNEWRCICLDFLSAREGGSWDLRGHEVKPLSRILEEIFF